jgi:hypothetical protein
VTTTCPAGAHQSDAQDHLQGYEAPVATQPVGTQAVPPTTSYAGPSADHAEYTQSQQGLNLPGSDEGSSQPDVLALSSEGAAIMEERDQDAPSHAPDVLEPPQLHPRSDEDANTQSDMQAAGQGQSVTQASNQDGHRAPAQLASANLRVRISAQTVLCRWIFPVGNARRNAAQVVTDYPEGFHAVVL